MSIKKLLGSMTPAGILSIAGGLTATSVFAAEYKDPEPLPEGTTIEDAFFDQVDDDRVLPMSAAGRAGNFSEAYDTLHGKLSGMELPANTGCYCWALNG